MALGRNNVNRPGRIGLITSKSAAHACCFSAGMLIRSFRDLDVWQLAMEFVVQVYRLTRNFPREELYGLTAQLRRAAVAVPSNISEGHQQGTKAYLHYVAIALGTLAEADTQIEVARRLGMTSPDEVASVLELAATLRKALHGLRRSLANRIADPRSPIPDP